MLRKRVVVKSATCSLSSCFVFALPLLHLPLDVVVVVFDKYPLISNYANKPDVVVVVVANSICV